MWPSDAFEPQHEMTTESQADVLLLRSAGMTRTGTEKHALSHVLEPLPVVFFWVEQSRDCSLNS
jgi:hypothetical protein